MIPVEIRLSDCEKSDNKDDVLLVAGKDLNKLCRIWPNIIAFECFELLQRDIIHGSRFSEENQAILKKVLEDSYPYYQGLFSRLNKDKKRDYLRSFFAGACGFYAFTHQHENINMDSDKLRAYFEDSDYKAFCACKSENTLVKEPIFGDFVITFRMIQLLFRTIIKTELFGGEPVLGESSHITKRITPSKSISEDEQITKSQKRLYEALQLYDLIYEGEIENAGYELESYNKYSLTKELAENPALFISFLKCGEKLDNPPAVSISPTSLHEAVRWEIQWITHFMSVNEPKSTQRMLRKCQYCGDFYIYGSYNRSKRLIRKYCSNECRTSKEKFKELFYECGETLRKRSENIVRQTQIQVSDRGNLERIFTDKKCLEKVDAVLKQNKIASKFRWVAYLVILGAIYYKSPEADDNSIDSKYPYQRAIESLFNGQIKFVDLIYNNRDSFSDKDMECIRICLFECDQEKCHTRDDRSVIAVYMNKHHFSRDMDITLMEATYSYFHHKLPQSMQRPVLCSWKY